MAGEDDDQKTEDPTQKRLEEAVEKGNVANSREVGSFFMIATLALLVITTSGSIMQDTKLMLMPMLGEAHSFPMNREGLGTVLWDITFGSLYLITIPLMATFVAAVASGVLQKGFHASMEPIMPKLSKISPIEGVKRLFSMRSLMEFLKGIIKITIAGLVGYWAVEPELGHMRQLTDSSIEATLFFINAVVSKILIWIAIAMFFIAGLDFFYQRWQHLKSLRMSKQEIKDEYKQSEGDPMIKMRLRQIRMERARNRMMAEVPKADVVITNPTHFAVALKYDTTVMKAPVVVAKGQDLIALKIREVAEEHDIPIVENPPLARALFSSSKLEEEIPIDHYEAVAKVISYVYKLKGKKK